MNNIIKTASIIIFTTVIMIVMLEIINELDKERDGNNKDYYVQYSGIIRSGLLSYLNLLTNSEENDSISILDAFNPFFYAISIIVSVSFPVLRKLNRKNCSNAEAIAFGAYTSAIMYFIYSFIEIINFNSLNFISVFNMMITGLGMGISASLLGIMINLCIDFIRKAKKEESTFLYEVLGYKSSINKAAAVSSAGIWLLFLICMTVMAFIRFIV